MSISTRGEIYNIPIYYFWKGFEREFEWNWKKEEPEQADSAEDVEDVTESDTSGKTADEPVHIPAAAIEDVTESDTFEECPAAVKGAFKNNRIKLRGGYESVLIDDLIHQYDTYRGMLSREDRQNRKQICKYDCLLDALELLKDRITQEECGAYDENNS